MNEIVKELVLIKLFVSDQVKKELNEQEQLDLEVIKTLAEAIAKKINDSQTEKDK